jgi:cytochrome c peroxidase
MVAVATFTLLAGCRPELEPLAPEVFAMERPDHFPDFAPFGDTEVTEAGFALGRRLFYDPKLSADSSVSCASCHAQVHAFADHNVRFSTGVGGALGTRNSPGLSNLAWHPTFMMDGGITHLEVQPLAPLNLAHEMAMDLQVLADRLGLDSDYPALFAEAFGEGETPVTGQRILLALTQFQVMLVSASSKYDAVYTGNEAFVAGEARGYALFQTHCASCHTEPLLTDFSFVNTGLDMHSEDAGRYSITLNPADSGAFVVPSLRNVALTRPYMHDGRFWSLEQVVSFYATGVQDNGRLDDRLPGPLPLTAADQADLVAFLKTLTDHEFTYDKRWMDPR